MKILITGAAGFIGAALINRLLEMPDKNYEVIGIDNLNDFYNPVLKLKRLEELGIIHTSISNKQSETNRIVSKKYPNFSFTILDITDVGKMDALFENEKFEIVVHLAAQAGVRQSKLSNRGYIRTNIDGFVNVLEGCINNRVKHLVYASSSSVYGLNSKIPFSEHDLIAHPVSLYAATKKSNELMAHVYSHLYGLPTTGLRFFTVYGPWGRPDMSPLLFIDSIMNNRPIKVFNNGDMYRDFTYIDDIVEGVVRIMQIMPKSDNKWNSESPDPAGSKAPYRIYNIGNSSPVKLMDYIKCIENITGMNAEKIFLPMHPGDVYRTYSDSSLLLEATKFRPEISLEVGLKRTIEWYKKFNYLLH